MLPPHMHAQSWVPTPSRTGEWGGDGRLKTDLVQRIDRACHATRVGPGFRPDAQRARLAVTCLLYDAISTAACRWHAGT